MKFAFDPSRTVKIATLPDLETQCSCQNFPIQNSGSHVIGPILLQSMLEIWTNTADLAALALE